MTGVVEMASMTQWKQSVAEGRKKFSEIRGRTVPSGDHNDKSDTHILPAWRQGVPPLRSDYSKRRDSNKGNGIHDNKTNLNKTLNNIHGNVKFQVGDGDPSEENISSMNEDGAVEPTAPRSIPNHRVMAVSNIDNSHLKHVHSNPFFRQLGVSHPHGRILSDSVDELLPELDTQLSRNSDMQSTKAMSTEEDGEEYSPHSGIVEKLKKKFSSLSKTTGSSTHIKRYGSLDNLLDRGGVEEEPKAQKFKGYGKTTAVDVLHVQQSTNKPVIRGAKPGVVVSRKPLPVNKIRKESLPVSSGQASEQVKLTSQPSAFKIPDEVSILPDNIIIIENREAKSSNHASVGSSKSMNSTQEIEQDELPKPNTVASVLTLFEQGKKKTGNFSLLPDAPRSPKFVAGEAPSANKPRKPVKAKKTSVSLEEGSEPNSPNIINNSSSVAPSAVPTSKTPNDSTTSIDNGSISSTVSSQEEILLPKQNKSDEVNLLTNSSDVTVSDIDKEKTGDIKSNIMSKSIDAITESTSESLHHQHPRGFDSPVTKKRNIGDMKSIFDSNAIKHEKPKVITKPRRINQTVKKANEDSKENTSNKILNGGVLNNDLDKMQKTDNLQTNKENILLSADNRAKGEEMFPGRKQIFDSSSIMSDNNQPKTKVRAPPRPKAVAKKTKLSSSSSIENDSTVVKDMASPSEEYKSLEKADLEGAELPPMPKSAPPSSSQSQVIPNLGGTVITSSGKDLISSSTPKQTPTVNGSSSVASVSRVSNNSNDTKPATPGVRSIKRPAPSVPKSSKDSVETQEVPSIELQLNDNTEKVSNYEPVEEKKERQMNGDDGPVRGIPSIIASRMQKESASASDVQSPDENKENEKDNVGDVVHHPLVKPSQLREQGIVKSLSSGPVSSPVPNKRFQNSNQNSSEILNVLEKTRPESASNGETLPQTNIDDLIRGRRSSPKALFDSSTIVAAPSPAASGVPRLDLSLIEEKRDHPYQEGYIPTKIEPCKIVFEGAGVKLANNPLKKKNKPKTKISFTNKEVQVHEYQSEHAALHDYLVQNPNEEKEAKKAEEAAVLQLEDFPYADQESSDDVEPETPRGVESSMKSNTTIGTSGDFGNYKSKMAGDFEFGMSMQEEEPEVKPAPQEEVVNPEDMDFLPADDEDTYNYTDTSIPDLLF